MDRPMVELAARVRWAAAIPVLAAAAVAAGYAALIVIAEWVGGFDELDPAHPDHDEPGEEGVGRAA